MKGSVIVLILICVFGGSVSAIDVGFINRSGMKDYCEEVVAYVSNGKLEQAFELLKSQWLFPISEVESIQEKTTSQLSMVLDRFGSPFAISFVREEKVGEFAVRYTYVVKYEKHLIRWLFTFYRPGDLWLLNSFKWDDSIDGLF